METLKATERAMNNPEGAAGEDAKRLVQRSVHQVTDVEAQMLADVEAQMVAIIKSVGRLGYVKRTLQELVTIEPGQYITKKEAVESGFPIYGGGGPCDYYSASSNRDNRMVIAKDGVSRRCVRWVPGSFHLNHHGWTLKCKDESVLSERYLFFTLAMNQERVYDLAMGSAQKGISQKSMEQLQVVVPPLEFQTAVLGRLELLQSQVDALKSLREQSEDNAAFILNSYF